MPIVAENTALIIYLLEYTYIHPNTNKACYTNPVLRLCVWKSALVNDCFQFPAHQKPFLLFWEKISICKCNFFYPSNMKLFLPFVWQYLYSSFCHSLEISIAGGYPNGEKEIQVKWQKFTFEKWIFCHLKFCHNRWNSFSCFLSELDNYLIYCSSD